MTLEQLFDEVEKLKRKAKKINKISRHVMVIVSTRIKPRKML